jgi:nucleotide-binding universal stress UspA family protein
MSATIQRILFATDGSEYSAGAQRVAIDLAKRCGAELHVMTIILSTQDLEGVGTQSLRQSLENEANQRLDAVRASATSTGLACTSHLVYGQEPHREIVNTALDIGADLIVLGRRGKRGLARFMVGHATAWVAGNAPCRVLVVPRAAQTWSQRVLLATDGSAHSAAAAQAARAVASQCRLPVTVVSATTRSHSEARKSEARDAVERLTGELTGAGITADGVVAEGRPDEVVIETAASHGADLIVVGSHGRTGLSRLFLGSISERIMGQAQCPVLVTRAPD